MTRIRLTYLVLALLITVAAVVAPHLTGIKNSAGNYWPIALAFGGIYLVYALNLRPVNRMTGWSVKLGLFGFVLIAVESLLFLVCWQRIIPQDLCYMLGMVTIPLGGFILIVIFLLAAIFLLLGLVGGLFRRTNQ